MKLTSGSFDPAEGEGYIEYQGSNALSVIDEANLQTIAGELGVEYQHRTADSEPTLPDAPSTTVAYSDSGEVGNVIELYWIAALLMAALLGVELARATMLVARLRRLRVRSRSTTRAASGSKTEGGAA
jgi:Ca-activated chloride channel family protein